jgi:hypothetical protein
MKYQVCRKKLFTDNKRLLSAPEESIHNMKPGATLPLGTAPVGVRFSKQHG